MQHNLIFTCTARTGSVVVVASSQYHHDAVEVMVEVVGRYAGVIKGVSTVLPFSTTKMPRKAWLPVKQLYSQPLLGSTVLVHFDDSCSHVVGMTCV